MRFPRVSGLPGRRFGKLRPRTQRARKHGESRIAASGGDVQSREQPGTRFLAVFGRKRQPKDPFRRSAADRRAVEDEQPWFLAPDEEPDLDIEAGRSARMDDPEGPGR